MSTFPCTRYDVTMAGKCKQATHPPQTCTWIRNSKWPYFTSVKAWTVSYHSVRSECYLKCIFHKVKLKYANQIPTAIVTVYIVHLPWTVRPQFIATKRWRHSNRASLLAEIGILQTMPRSIAVECEVIVVKPCIVGAQPSGNCSKYSNRVSFTTMFIYHFMDLKYIL